VRYRDADGKQRLKTFETKREADLWAAQATLDLDDGIHVPDRASVTVSIAAGLWLARKRAKKNEEEGIDVEGGYPRLHIEPATVPAGTPNGWRGKFGDLKLAKLTSPIVDAFGLRLLETKSLYVARRALRTLRSIIRDARRRGLIKHNPAEGVTIDEKPREKAPLRIGVDIPDKSDIRAIFAAVAPDRVVRRGRGIRCAPFFLWRWYILFFTAAFTGMRASELRGLIWRNVDLIRRVITVDRRANRRGKIGPPKSKAGYREIPISVELADALREWKAICPTSTPDRFVFPNSLGRVLLHSHILRFGWYPVLKWLDMTDAEGNTKYGFHSLRHFYASIMIQAGVTPKRLQGLLGHAKISETMDTYAHLFEASKAETDQINGAVSAVLHPTHADKSGPPDDMT
jgi:integrase